MRDHSTEGERTMQNLGWPMLAIFASIACASPALAAAPLEGRSVCVGANGQPVGLNCELGSVVSLARGNYARFKRDYYEKRISVYGRLDKLSFMDDSTTNARVDIKYGRFIVICTSQSELLADISKGAIDWNSGDRVVVTGDLEIFQEDAAWHDPPEIYLSNCHANRF